MRTATQLTASKLAKYTAIAAFSLALAACGGDSDSKKDKDQKPENTTSSISFNQAELTAKAEANKAKELITINSDSIKVDNKALSAEQFKKLTLTLSGANKDLFSLDKTDTQATLSFNKAAIAIPKDRCAANVCRASIIATLNGKTATLKLSVSINVANSKELKIRLSHLNTDLHKQVIMRGNQCKKMVRGICTVVYKPRVSIPLVALLYVRDEGQTCIAKKDGKCDKSVTAITATYAQRKAYLDKYALTAKELSQIKLKIKGYTQNQVKTKAHEDKKFNDDNALFLFTPKGEFRGTKYYQFIGKQIRALNGTTNYFDKAKGKNKGGDLAHMLKDLAKDASCNESCAKNRHAYSAHLDVLNGKYSKTKQPLLRLDNLYESNTLRKLLQTNRRAYGKLTMDLRTIDAVGGRYKTNYNRMYPLDLEITAGKQTLNLSVDVIVMKHVSYLETKGSIQLKQALEHRKLPLIKGNTNKDFIRATSMPASYSEKVVVQGDAA